jgi:hypothetical protein
MRSPSHLLLLAAGLLAACSAVSRDDRPREELEGDPPAPGGSAPVPATGVGGATTTGPTSSAGGATTASTSVGVGGSGGMGSCSNLDEPNDSEATALSLGAINDCDNNEATLLGALDGPSDEDWYKYDGSDDFGCVVDPTRALTATGGLRLCKFAECDGVSVSCEDGSQSALSPKGNPGCCHSQGFGIDVGCSGIDDDATIIIRLDQAAEACVEYSLDYHY